MLCSVPVSGNTTRHACAYADLFIGKPPSPASLSDLPQHKGIGFMAREKMVSVIGYDMLDAVIGFTEGILRMLQDDSCAATERYIDIQARLHSTLKMSTTSQ